MSMPIEKYARFCGPAVVSSVYSAPREEAATMLTGLGGNVGDGGTTVQALTRALGVGAVWLKRWYPEKAKWIHTWRGSRYMDAYAYPTTTQFLREHPKGEYVLMSGNHVIHVKDGVVVKDNGTGGSRMRVKAAWPLNGAHVHRERPYA